MGNVNLLNGLAKKYGVKLPSTYIDWFQSGGPDSESFIGTDMDEPCLSDLQEWVQELLNESKSSLLLPDDSFVFAMHQGYQFYYFHCDGNNDPEVWYYMEGQEKPALKWNLLVILYSLAKL